MRAPVRGGHAHLPQVDVKAGAVGAEELEVVRSRFDGDDVGFRVTRVEPENAAANVRPAVDNQWLTSGGNDLLVDILNQNTVGADRHVVLGLGETLVDGHQIGGIVATVLHSDLLPATFGFVDGIADGDIWIGNPPGLMEHGLHDLECGAAEGRGDNTINGLGTKIHCGFFSKSRFFIPDRHLGVPGRASESDAEAEVYVLLVTGVGVEIVGSATVELVALPEFASDKEAESYCSEAGRDPAYGFDEGAFFFGFIAFPATEGENAGAGDILCLGVAVAGCGAEPHNLDNSSGALSFGEPAALFRCCFCVIGSLDAKQ